jgi:hypothetical protein
MEQRHIPVTLRSGLNTFERAMRSETAKFAGVLKYFNDDKTLQCIEWFSFS